MGVCIMAEVINTCTHKTLTVVCSFEIPFHKWEKIDTIFNENNKINVFNREEKLRELCVEHSKKCDIRVTCQFCGERFYPKIIL